MDGFITYLIRLGRKLDLKPGCPFDTCELATPTVLKGHVRRSHLTIFADGEIWISAPRETEESDVPKVLEGLAKIFKASGVKESPSSLLESADRFEDEIPPAFLLFADPSFDRPTLGAKMHLNPMRLGMFRMMKQFGSVASHFISGMGRDVGITAYAAASAEIKDKASADRKLAAFLKDYGIGVMSIAASEKPGEQFRVRLRESSSCSGLPATGKCMCFFEQGIVRGFYTKFYTREVEVKCERCQQLGDDECEYSVSMWA